MTLNEMGVEDKKELLSGILFGEKL